MFGVATPSKPHKNVGKYTHTYTQINYYSKVVVQEQEHVNMSNNLSNWGNLRGGPSHHRCHHPWFLLSVWKHRLYACTVRRTHISKHIDTSCAYRYHHCVSQYRWYRIFGIGIGPSLVYDIVGPRVGLSKSMCRAWGGCIHMAVVTV